MNSVRLPSDADHSGRDLGSEELELVRQALASGTLTSTKGTFVKQLEKEFADRLGVRYAYACTSGSAAVHTAVAALNPNPGDEIITTPITDMGALTCILYQGAIPVFCDVDPDSYNVTAATIEPRISGRTRAVIVTHLFGVPCDMGPIMELCDDRGIPVIEDCAQAYDGIYAGKRVGTFGKAGCFSLQQGKHMTTGEGGILVTDDPEWARRSFLFINKAWGYGDADPDHYFVALNYRMNEITGAVALAQLAKLSSVVKRRQGAAKRFTAMISDLPGARPQSVPKNAEPTFWKFCVNIDEEACGRGLSEIARVMRASGIFAVPRYIGKLAFECKIFRDKVTFGDSSWPYTDPSRTGLPPVDHDRKNFPGADRALSQVLVIPWNEFYVESHLEYIAQTLRRAIMGGDDSGQHH